MERYSNAESTAIQDRARIFVRDERVGTSVGGIETFLQRHRNNIDLCLRRQNRGRGLNDKQISYMKAISQIYDAIAGLNASYSEDFLQRIKEYLESAHNSLDEANLKNRAFLSKRGLARARKNVVLDGKEYFWNVHLDTTRDLIENVCRIRNGESETDVFRTANAGFYDKIREGSLDAGELADLLNEGRYLFRRTFVNTGYDGHL